MRPYDDETVQHCCVLLGTAHNLNAAEAQWPPLSVSVAQCAQLHAPVSDCLFVTCVCVRARLSQIAAEKAIPAIP